MKMSWDMAVWFLCNGDEHLILTDKGSTLREQHTIGDMINLYNNIVE